MSKYLIANITIQFHRKVITEQDGKRIRTIAKTSLAKEDVIYKDMELLPEILDSIIISKLITSSSTKNKFQKISTKQILKRLLFQIHFSIRIEVYMIYFRPYIL